MGITRVNKSARLFNATAKSSACTLNVYRGKRPMVLLSTSEFTPPRYPSSNRRWTRITRKSLIEGPRDVLKPLARTRENTPKNPLPLLWNPKDSLFIFPKKNFWEKKKKKKKKKKK